MDNLTHTLIGLATAEIALALRSSNSKKKENASSKKDSKHRARRYFWLTAVLSNNFPDLDFLYATISGPQHGYALHHRGHTHTFILAPVLAALVLACVYLYSIRKGVFSKKKKSHLGFSNTDWRWLLILAGLGPLLHIFADGWNSYGIHPFWPFFNGWLYGDAIFIVEPFLWAALLPMHFFNSEGKQPQKVITGVTLAVILLLVWIVPFVPWVTALFFTLWMGIILYSTYIERNEDAGRVSIGISAAALFLLVSFALRMFVERDIRSHIITQSESATIHDVILTPYAANPVCWLAMTVETEGIPRDYILRSFMYSLAPSVLPADKCPKIFNPDPKVPLEKIPFENSSKFHWYSQFRAPLVELKTLHAKFCGASAFLRVNRAPYWIVEEDKITMGDFRFARIRENNASRFFSIEGPDLENCPPYIPNWTPPRFELILGKNSIPD